MNIVKFIALFAGLLILSGCAAPKSTPTTTSAFEPSSAPPQTETTATSIVQPDKLIALTFDDGPSVRTMAEVLDLLAQYDAKATFFVIGRKINSGTTPVLQRAVNEGHEIANHSMDHVQMAELTDEEIMAQVEDCQKAVKDAVGVDMYYFRAPFGSIDDRMRKMIKMPFMSYGAAAGDGTIGSIAEDRAWRITSKAYDGCIVLMHCFQGNDETVKALAIILPELQAQGYEFVTLTELFTRNGGTVPDPDGSVSIKDNKPIE